MWHPLLGLLNRDQHRLRLTMLGIQPDDRLEKLPRLGGELRCRHQAQVSFARQNLSPEAESAGIHTPGAPSQTSPRLVSSENCIVPALCSTRHSVSVSETMPSMSGRSQKDKAFPRFLHFPGVSTHSAEAGHLRIGPAHRRRPRQTAGKNDSPKTIRLRSTCALESRSCRQKRDEPTVNRERTCHGMGEMVAER